MSEPTLTGTNFKALAHLHLGTIPDYSRNAERALVLYHSIHLGLGHPQAKLKRDISETIGAMTISIPKGTVVRCLSFKNGWRRRTNIEFLNKVHVVVHADHMPHITMAVPLSMLEPL